MPQRKLSIIKDQSEQHQNQVALLDPSLWSDYVTTVAMVNVEVRDPITEGEGRHTYTAYNVVTEKASVRRRYSDFQWLYKRLQTELPGAIIPIIPHRRALVVDIKFSKEFIESRRVNLEKFIKAVLEHDELKNAPSMTPFMTSELGEDFDTAKQTVENARPSTHEEEADEASAGPTVGKRVGNFLAKANTLMQVRTGHVEIEQTKEDPEINVIKEYIGEVEIHAKQLMLACQALVKTTIDKSNAIHDFGIPVAAWKSTHQNSVKNSQESILATMSSVIEFSDECTSLFEEQHGLEKAKFEAAMQQLMLDIQAFNVALKKRRNLQVTYTTKLKQINDKETAIDKATKALKPPEVTDRLASEKQGLEREAEPIKAALDDCSVRLIREASRAQPLLGHSLRNCIKEYADIQIEYTTKLKEAWKKLLPMLGDSIPADAMTAAPAPVSPTHVPDDDPEIEELDDAAAAAAGGDADEPPAAIVDEV
mmetsp:Transcript_4306/g.12312  ORF Transcript_4306/g.12312 Transcript_4306/m.12312 type:complete len:480 (+) Transcript_4306:119-1558(+)